MCRNSFGGLLGRGHGTLRLWPLQRVQRRWAADGLIDSILEPGAPLLEFFDLLVGREIDFFFDPVDGFVQGMILIKHLSEIHVTSLQQLDRFAIFREFPQDGVMEVCSSTHSVLLQFRLL